MTHVMAGQLVLMLLAGGAAAQDTSKCFPGKGSNEARTMAIFDVPLAYSGAVAPTEPRAGRFHLALEMSYLPKVDPAVGTPTTCRPEKTGPDNTDLLFAVPRPRLSLGLPGGFAIEVSWIPPVRLSEVKANLFGVALSRTTRLNRSGAELEIRGHATLGSIKAPITCNDAALQDGNSPCYHGTRSNDAFKPNVFGVAAAIGWSAGRSFRPYLGAGYNHLAPRFQVNFTNQFSAVDRRTVIVDLDRAVLFAGATWRASSVLDLSGEIYSAPVDAVTGRLTARVRLGKKPATGSR